MYLFKYSKTPIIRDPLDRTRHFFATNFKFTEKYLIQKLYILTWQTELTIFKMECRNFYCIFYSDLQLFSN